MLGSFIFPEIIKAPVKIDNTSFKLLAGSNYQVGGYGVKLDSDLITTTSTSLDIGSLATYTLYYIYLVVTNGTYKCVLSLNSTAPIGYLAYKKIGVCTTDASSNILFCGTVEDSAKPFTYVLPASGSSLTILGSFADIYKDPSGVWTADIRIHCQASAAFNSKGITLSGITTINMYQNVSCSIVNYGGYSYPSGAMIYANSNELYIVGESGATSFPTSAHITFDGSIKLSARPTFVPQGL